MGGLQWWVWETCVLGAMGAETSGVQMCKSVEV